MTNVAVVGLGHWGPNLVRNFAAISEAWLHTLCDIRPDRLATFERQYPGARTQTDFGAVVDDPEVDAIVIATPVHTHYQLAKTALDAGKHVMVEKPLAQTSDQCRKLVALAEKHQLILMVGHVFLYNAAVRKVKEYIDSGELGQIHYIYSQRLNLGIVRQDVNALWNFAPHDLSILCYWLNAAPAWVAATGFCYIQPGIEDIVFMTLGFPEGVAANVHISWLDPGKVRRMTVVGSRRMVIYDDVSADAKVVIYDKGISRIANESPLGSHQSFGEFQLLLRAGDVLIPKIDFMEPLKLECQHFVECIRTKRSPITDGHNGTRVVEILEAAQRAIAVKHTVRVESRL